MAGNKYLQADRSVLLKTKLNNLSRQLQTSLKSGNFATREQFLFESIKMVERFYRDMTEPLLQDIQIYADSSPDPKIWNDLWQTLIDDLTIVFSELENIETLTISNFNFIITETNRITSRLKAVSSKLGDYILYSNNPNKDALFSKDSFNDLSKIDINSAFLNTDQCNIDQAQGIISLPIDTSADSSIAIRRVPTINPKSNGNSGNNFEVNKAHNGELSVLLDNNPDTWFEYERVTTTVSDSKDSLILDLVVNLDQAEIINFIRINPNNFGTKTVVKIKTIETSLDGQVYTSIVDDIPTGSLLTEDQENPFVLAPSTSKFAGQGLYTFTPRRTKYVHIVFEQDEPYIISTNIGDRLRYAIGIRDIDIRAVSYLSMGELVSKPFEFTDEVRKVLLNVNQIPLQNFELGKITYLVSPDDGATWHQLRPQEVTAATGITTIPNILEFNGGGVNSITTAVPVQSIRLKTVLERLDNNFIDGNSSFNKTVVTKAETHQIPENSPFTIDLEKAPVNGTVVLVDPLYGSRGMADYPYFIGFTGETVRNQTYHLPFKTFPRPLKKDSSGGVYFTTEPAASEWIHVSIGGEEWNHIDDDTYTSGKIYQLDVNTGILQFGNPIGGDIPSSDMPIAMWMEPERLYPGITENNHIAALDFTASSNKLNMTIQRYDPITAIIDEVLPKRASVIKLKNTNVVSYTDIASKLNTAGFTTERTYRNGRDELVSDEHWSIDTEHGIIYLATPTNSVTPLTVDYTYQPIVTLDAEDWGWETTSLLRDSVAIKESKWKTNLVEAESLASAISANVSTIDLPHLAVVENSLSFVVSNVSGVIDADSDVHPLLKEVAYLDGTTEFNQEDAGLYSINYQKGQIFFQRALDASITDIEVNYEYTDYRAKYHIARILDPRSYEVDITNHTVTINDNEIMRRALMPHKRLDERAPYYLVNYDYVSESREDIESLQPYYSPIVQDYALKILTKGRIF